MAKLAETSLNEVLPLPFRVALLFQLGVHLWYAMVWVCYRVYDVNCLALLDLSYSSHNYALDGQNTGLVYGELATIIPAELKENLSLLLGIKATGSKLFSALAFSLVCYWLCKAVISPDFFLFAPIVNLLFLFITVYSFYVVFRPGKTIGQQRVHSSIKRILIGNINSATMRTNDIFFSDTLTSYAKVLNDLMCFIWITFVTSDSLYNTRVEALVLAFPQLVRMKQCYYEYKVCNQRQQLFNFFKYAALLGPILVNMLIKLNMLRLASTGETTTDSLDRLNNWWYISSTVSSLYLFVWDVRMDWGYGLFEFYKSRRHYEPLRAGRLVFGRRAIYFFIIFIDFVLRFIWFFKMFVIVETEIELGLRHRVGNFLFGYNFLLLGYLILETLEIFRRWLWCFLKWEHDLSKLQPKDAEAIQLSDLKSG
ncbi:hypothetical protein PUMCH_002073 [Australozyma saopauloensis]|uniref:EXS domain-containing protein n=1 Tax=Australozyma saopauloensis TaxID=291208 RepID=A0AAX4H8C8_9ASCO|nr:hypothetical protein PUMCH_002073 [[Candida] saopauloensis]